MAAATVVEVVPGLKLAGVEDGVAVARIDRPTRKNAMTLEMWAAIPAVLDMVRSEHRARVLLFRGGRDFSVGADIREFVDVRSDAAKARRYTDTVNASLAELARFPLPTVAAISGNCYGGGCDLALCCDVRVAGDGATFAITPAKLGIVYSASSTKRLVDAVGAGWARYLLLTASPVMALDARQIGLVHEVVADADLEEHASMLAARLASLASVSLTGSKLAVGLVSGGVFPESPVSELIYERSYESPEYAEGVAAFVARRAPDFRRAAEGKPIQDREEERT